MCIRDSDGRIITQGVKDLRAFQETCTLDDGVKSYLKGGSMLVTKERQRRSTAAMATDPYTLIVGLDITQKSEGDLYIDDGHSYAFQKGHYVYRKFDFNNYVLRSEAGFLPGMPRADSSFKPSNRIERIAILGFAGGASKWTATLNGVELDGQAEKLHVGGPGSQVAFVIREPGVLASEDWEIAFSKKIV